MGQNRKKSFIILSKLVFLLCLPIHMDQWMQNPPNSDLKKFFPSSEMGLSKNRIFHLFRTNFSLNIMPVFEKELCEEKSEKY